MFLTKRAGRYLVSLPLAAVCAVAASGCGGDEVPAGAVAKVGDTVITKEQFDHWYASAAKAQAQEGGPAVAPDPPDYAGCIAALKKAQPKDSPTPDDKDLKKQCKRNYDGLEKQTMQFLVQSQWILQEAEDRDLSVTGAEARKAFEKQRKASLPKESDYEKYLRDNGATEQDLIFRVKLSELQNKLTAQVMKDRAKVSDEDIQEYWDKYKKRFAEPERRDLKIVLTKNKAKADEAKRQLDAGAGFSSVAKKYSIDQASKANGGKLPAVAKGQQEKAFDEAIFKAEKGEVEGPIRTQFGWYVFEVTGSHPARRQTLEESKHTIRGSLKSEREQKAMKEFVEGFREEHKGETICADEFRITECSNAPEEKTDTNPPRQGAPPDPNAPQAPTAPAPQQSAP